MKTTSRRIFMGTATAVSAMRVLGANDRLSVGLVGIGGRGTNHLNIYSRLPESRVAALCDVNQAARERAQTALTKTDNGQAKEYSDMREMFADKDIDAVSIATPNHWHALASIWAMKAGKDVYCEKPASHNIHEGLTMLKVSRDSKKMLQIGSQHRSTPFKMKAMEALHGGLIGKIYMAKGLCFKRRKSIGKTPLEPVPAGVNWDLFLGPAQMKEFSQNRFKYNWHWFWDTGNGDIGNQGVHEMGVCRWGLEDPQLPNTAYSQGGKFAYDDDQETPNTQMALFDYGGREIQFEVRGLLTGGEGFVTQPRPRAGDTPTETAPKGGQPMSIMVGNLFFGTEGWAAMSNGFQAFKGDSNELVMELKPDRDSDGDTTGLHMKNFIAACKSRRYQDLHDEIGIAHQSAALCHLANISYRTGRKLTIKTGANGSPEFVGDSEAMKMLTRSYRKPYVV